MTAATLNSVKLLFGENEEVHDVTFEPGYTYTPTGINISKFTWSINGFTAGAGAGPAATKLVLSAGVFTFTANVIAGATANSAYNLVIRIVKSR